MTQETFRAHELQFTNHLIEAGILQGATHYSRACVDWCLERGIKGLTLRDCIRMCAVQNKLMSGIELLDAERQLLDQK